MADPAAPLAASPVSDVGLASAAVHMAVALLAILAVILLAFWILRRFGSKFGIVPGGRGAMLRVLAQIGLGPRKSVVVVRFLNKDLVLGVTDHAITLLTEVPTDHDTQTPFADTLAREAGSPQRESPADKSR